MKRPTENAVDAVHGDLPCGHQVSNVVQGGEGTAYCDACEDAARLSAAFVLSLEHELAILRNFEQKIRDAHTEHLRTGDYTKLGMAAQDAVRELKAVLRSV